LFKPRWRGVSGSAHFSLAQASVGQVRWPGKLCVLDPAPERTVALRTRGRRL